MITTDVIIPSAGNGSRMGNTKNKLLLPLNKIPILLRTLQIFYDLPFIENIVLPIQPKDELEIKTLCKNLESTHKKIDIIYGGKTRSESVKKGLRYLQEKEKKSNVILVHDGARPFVSKNLIENLVTSTLQHGASIPIYPITDTLRQKRDKSFFTVDRNEFYTTQTPQAFLYDYIEPCFFSQSCSSSFTDEASYIEANQYPFTTVLGEKWNIKITTPEDLLWAESYLKIQFH